MPEISSIIPIQVDLDAGLAAQPLRMMLAAGNANAHTLRFSALRSGVPVDLTGVQVSGACLRADGSTVPLAGAIVSGAAVLTLSAACYAVPGLARLSLTLSYGSATATHLLALLQVNATTTDLIVDPEGVLPSLAELLAEIDKLRSATADAKEAAAQAETATAELTRQFSAALSDIAPPIIQRECGDGVLAVSDSTGRPLAHLALYGKTTQAGTPTPEAPVPMVNAGAGGSIGVNVRGKNLFDSSTLTKQNGALFEVNENTVHIYTPSSTTYCAVRTSAITMHAGVKYVMSADVSDIVSGEPSLGFRDADTMRYVKRAYVSDGRIVLTYTPTETVRMYACLLVTGGTASDGDATFANIQLEVGASATAYEPFKDGGSMTISTPNGLPGLPVDSGGNFTDANGQQWICDEIDFTRGTYIKRIGSLTMDGSQICAWTSYPTMPNAGYLSCSLSEYDAADPQHIATALSDSFINRAGQAAGLFDHGSFRLAVDSSALTFSLDGVSNTSAAMQWFKEHPATFLYVREHPAGDFLSDDELAAFAALKSQYPHTTVFNDGGAGMALSYIADTKRYIDNKFAALAAASVNA